MAATPELSVDDFAGLLSYCVTTKMSLSHLFRSVPNTFSFTADGNELLFLSTAGSATGGNSLFSVPVVGGKWQRLEAPEQRRQLSRSEQLLRERMRETSSGITHYTYLPPAEQQQQQDSVLVNTGSVCRLVKRCLQQLPPEPEEVLTTELQDPSHHQQQEEQQQQPAVLEYPRLSGALDYKLCPGDHTLLACSHQGELWLLDTTSQCIHQLTHAAESAPAGRKVTAGQSSFILQEEFDRYTGYWWYPQSGDNGLHTILYEQVDETDVELVHTFNPSNQTVDDYRYPRPGGVNAVSTLRLLQFTMDNGKPTVVHNDLPPSLGAWLAEWEYYPRIGWTSDGNSVWVILLNRSQQKTQLATIPMATFLTTPTATPIILSEETSDTYINMQKLSLVHHLPPTSHNGTRLITVSQSTGYYHIVLVEQPEHTAPPTVQLLTEGPWVIMGDQVWSSDDIVYFEANKSSPLDRHLYAIKLSQSPLPATDPIQLTPSGYYHKCVVCPEKGLFVATSSSLSSAPSVTVYKVTPSSLAVERLFTVWQSVALPLSYTPPMQFTAQTSSGVALYGVVYPPLGAEPGKQYPTVLYVYGGPEVQIVTNGFSRLVFHAEQWRRAGFAVVMVDNRGSANRGVEFESAVKLRMGNVEVEDQVTGLLAGAAASGCVDTSRVAVTGWSYGGYMALMCIAQRPDVFKLAISGAPVTDWLWYDTGYTERYLGIPPHDSNAYQQSSVIKLAPQFPNESNRVLIIHGMTDENVLYTHTSTLVDALVAHGKPYQLQIYTSERHGLQSPSAANHCDATILSFLLKHL